MTTLRQTTAQCGLCGQESTHATITSTNRFGASDLDLRPPEMERSTIDCWVRRCPRCGYCARNIANGTEQAQAIVQSAEYQSQLKSDRYPELANSFLCSALVHEAERNLADAGWSALYAAWACDDARPQAAPLCRMRAIELFAKAAAAGQEFVEGPGEEEALLADLYRRTGQFDKVRQVCAAAAEKKPPPFLRDILELQVALANQGDTNCHTDDEARHPGRAP